jgi:tetratricopeptide (TPR) repeat protein
MEGAIYWYKEARKDFRRNSYDKFLGARISNDLGYAHSQVGEWEECLDNVKEGQQVRQALVRQFEKAVQDLKKALKLSVDKIRKVALKKDLRHAEVNLSKARFHLGLSYSTLGEIYRYRDDVTASLRNYTDAINLFKKEKKHTWHVRALFSRGETHRRHAWKMYKEGDEGQFNKHIDAAKEDILESLFLCKRHRVRDERDTANRRMGRVLHDLALHALEHKEYKKAREFLDLAGDLFDIGLVYARENHDVLEELSNLTERAFIYDDYLRILGGGKVTQKYKGALDELKRVLDGHRNKPNRIYQFEVFDNLYEMEKAAVEYREGQHDKALEGYLKAYSSLAADPGYGRVKYRSLFRHLVAQVENLPQEEAEAWCKAFLLEWEEKSVVIRGRKTTLAQESIKPDLVLWFWEHLKELGASLLAGSPTTDAPLPDSKKKNKRKG